MSKKLSLWITAVVLGLVLVGLTISQASEFTVNTHRFDPYKQFKFRVKWDGRYVPGIISVSGLTRITKVVLHRQGTEPSVVRKSPGQTAYEPTTLKRGRTHDTEFEKWMNKVFNFGSGFGSEVSLQDFRKDIIIELYNEAGQLAMAFRVYRCWPSRYSALNKLDATSQDIALETMVLEHEGWERDYEVMEPSEPSFTEPE